MICSKDNLDEEVKTIKKILTQNGYPERLVARIIENKIKSFQNPLPPKGPNKAPVYMKLPYIGNVSEVYRKRIKSAIAKCFGDSVSPRIHLISKPMLKTATKDVLSKTKQSSVLYRFNCSCESSYIGRTSRSLETRIGEHVPKDVKEKIKKFHTKPARHLSHTSSIAEHLLNNPDCGKKYDPNMFNVVGHGRSNFHLSVLEALFILHQKPDLCKQKQFVYSTILFR